MFDALMSMFWTAVFSLIPAILLGNDFGLSIGVGYAVVASILMSIYYAVHDTAIATKSMQRNLNWTDEDSAIRQVLDLLDWTKESSSSGQILNELMWHKEASTAQQLLRAIESLESAIRESGRRG